MTFYDIDIAKSIKTIEWTKSEILKSVSELYKILIDSANLTKDIIIAPISRIIIFSYVLGQRLGIDFEEVDKSIKTKLKSEIEKNTQVEIINNDFSKLLIKFDKTLSNR